MYNLMDISGSGMSAHKTFLEVTSNNIANQKTTRTENGGPYQRQAVSFQEMKDFDNAFKKEMGKGVEVDQIHQDDNVEIVYDPEHPDANEEGYVEYPAINQTAEMTNLLMGQRGYESNESALNTAKKMFEKTLELGK